MYRQLKKELALNPQALIVGQSTERLRRKHESFIRETVDVFVAPAQPVTSPDELWLFIGSLLAGQPAIRELDGIHPPYGHLLFEDAQPKSSTVFWRNRAVFQKIYINVYGDSLAASVALDNWKRTHHRTSGLSRNLLSPA